MGAAFWITLALVATPLAYAVALTILLLARPGASLADAAEALSTAMRRGWTSLVRSPASRTSGKGRRERRKQRGA